MRASRPVVHPVEAPPPPAPPTPGHEQADGEGVARPRGVRMKDPPGAPGTPAGLGLRLAQTFFAAAALAVMAATNDFPSVSAFSYSRSKPGKRRRVAIGFTSQPQTPAIPMDSMICFTQLPCCSSYFTMFMEPFISHCGYLCTSCQTFIKECPGCMYIYHRRWDHRNTDLGCGMCISRYYCSHR